MPAFFYIKGSLDIDKLEYSFIELIKRHEVLRTTFDETDGEYFQIIEDEVSFSIEREFIDLDKLSSLNNIDDSADLNTVESYILKEANRKNKIHEICKAFIKPFNLKKGPLFRVKVVIINQTEIIMMYDIHHIISDGGSQSILIKELISLYRDVKLAPIKFHYKTFAAWQKKQNINREKEYWLKEFENGAPTLDLKTDFPRPKEQSYKGANYALLAGTNITHKIKVFANENKSTEFMFLLSVFMLMLSRYTNQEEIVVGTPVSGRVHLNTMNMPGMFVNSLALKGVIDPEESFLDFLMSVKQKCMNAYDNQAYPFEELVDSINLQRDMSRNPIFDVMFIHQRNTTSEIRFDNIEVTPIGLDLNVAKLDITLTVGETNSGYEINFEYCTELFKKETIERMARHYVTLLENVLRNPYEKIRNINMVGAEEREQLISKFNNTTVDYPKDKTIIDLFEMQVAKTPDNIAAIYDDKKLTYRELNAKVNSLATKLRNDYDINPDDFIAIISERSLEMVIGIYAIIKAGAAYVPIDPIYPKERIEYMLNDCQPKALLKGNVEINFTTNMPIVSLNDPANYELSQENPKHINWSENLIYLIYTSGTTGNPKGVMVEHRNIVNQQIWTQKEYPLNPSDSILMKTTCVFDVFAWEIFWWILDGATVIILPQEEQGLMYRSGDLARWAKDGNVEFLGRLDEQVKIRGFRVEISDIEENLLAFDEVKNVAVVSFDDKKGKYLCAYIVSDKEISQAEIKEKLSEKLPEYMIPQYIIQIDNIPVTKNGKVDKKALTAPKNQETSQYIAAGNSAEKLVVSVFEEVLAVNKVSIRDSFFELGGDSIKAIRVAGKIREKGYSITMKTILSEKTPENIAKEIKKETSSYEACQEELSGECPLLPIQKLFFGSKLKNNNHFNQSLIYECKERITINELSMILDKIILHHDILRSSFANGIQNIGANKNHQYYLIKEYETDINNIDKLSDELQSSLDIVKGRLISAGLFHTSKKDYVLLVIHHLVVDAVSFRIIGEDVEKCYKQLKNGQELLLADKTSSYMEWGNCLNDYAKSYMFKKEIPYWNKIEKEIESGRFVKNGRASANSPKTAYIKLPKNLTMELMTKANRLYNTTTEELLLSILAIKSLKGIQLAGESLTASLVNSYRGPGEIVNYYGPTEATVYASGCVCPKGEPVVYIGKPLDNIQIYIQNDNKLCGIGIPGELCISGISLAKGYLNKPELTKEKFTANPFAKGLLYHTGDLARFMPDGNIEYLGRIDEQVKIRGFRIETEEIVCKLCEMEEITGAVVIPKEDKQSNKFLCAYVCSHEEIDPYEIKNNLRNSLPDYMIPAYICQIKAIPVTKSGKLDKKALPEPEYKNVCQYVSPRNNTEKILAQIFEEILGIDNVSVLDSFFELGGHSLLCNLLINMIKERLNAKITFKEIFAYATIENMGKHIDEQLSDENGSLSSVALSSYEGMEVE